MTKICTWCKFEKDISEFSPRPERPNGARSKCRACSSEIQIARYASNPEKYREVNRRLGSVPKSRFSRFKKRCAHTKKYFELTFEQWSELVLGKPCHYCGGPLETKGCGLDRKDNSLGYVLSNVAACCKECNRIKGHTLTYTEMLEVSALLKRLRAA